MDNITIINDGSGRVQVAPAGNEAAFRDAVARAIEAGGDVRTVTTETGVGVDMSVDTATKAGFIKKQTRARKAPKEIKE